MPGVTTVFADFFTTNGFLKVIVGFVATSPLTVTGPSDDAAAPADAAPIDATPIDETNADETTRRSTTRRRTLAAFAEKSGAAQATGHPGPADRGT